MSSENESLEKLVNASGFMFQLALERAVEETTSQHGFEVEAREHPWRRDGETSFIDLILGRNIGRLVCECKRTRDAKWIFPVEHDRHDVDRVRLQWVQKRQADRAVAGWHDFHLTTGAPEATFCVVRGHGENNSPMLERIAGTLLLSVEALASEEASLLKFDSPEDRRVYLPIIVTTASLMICRYDPMQISLATGMLSGSTYDEVPMVLFRKALSSPMVELKRDDREMAYAAFRRHSRDQERSVLVINSNSFIDTLVKWKWQVYRDTHDFPWQ